MIFFSARENFWETDDFCMDKDDAIAEVDLESGETNKVSKNKILAQLKDKKVLILVHGYNCERHEVIAAYLSISKYHHYIWQQYDKIIGYAWPGGDREWEYFSAKRRSKKSGKRFKSLLQELLTTSSEVGVMGHSMGCRVTLKAVDLLQEELFPKKAKLELFLTAAAIDNDTLEKGERYYEATLLADSTYVFYSKKDDVLSVACKLTQLDNAMGMTGPENPEDTLNTVKIIDCVRVVKRHGDYKRCMPLFEYLKKEDNGTSAPKKIKLSHKKLEWTMK